MRRCAFCHRTAAEVKHLVAGPDEVYICDECVAACMRTIADLRLGALRGDDRLLEQHPMRMVRSE